MAASKPTFQHPNGATRTRTAGLVHAMHTLCQLSYSPLGMVRTDTYRPACGQIVASETTQSRNLRLPAFSLRCSHKWSCQPASTFTGLPLGSAGGACKKP